MSNEEEDKRQEELREEQELGPQFGSNVGVMTGKEPRSGLPASFCVTRQILTQSERIEKDLFTEIEKKYQEVNEGNRDDEGKAKSVIYLISNLPQKVSEYDFMAFIFAISQILYNQSYINGTTETNSGINKEEDENLSNMAGRPIYFGRITTTVGEICKLGYGVKKPPLKFMVAQEALIDALHQNPIKLSIPGIMEAEEYLCTTTSKRRIYVNLEKRKKTLQQQKDQNTEQQKATGERKDAEIIFYSLTLHPILTDEIKKNYVKLPQDIMERLTKATKKKTPAHLKLMRILSSWRRDGDKNKPLTYRIENIIEDLGLKSLYRKHTSRTEEQLLSIFQSMVDINLLKEFKIEYRIVKNSRRIDKVIFFFRDDFI